MARDYYAIPATSAPYSWQFDIKEEGTNIK
jgi:hypothetical protein